MLDWLTENLATIIVLIAVVAVVAGVIAVMVRDKKQGKSSCGCSCGNCPMSGKCHEKK